MLYHFSEIDKTELEIKIKTQISNLSFKVAVIGPGLARKVKIFYLKISTVKSLKIDSNKNWFQHLEWLL